MNALKIFFKAFHLLANYFYKIIFLNSLTLVSVTIIFFIQISHVNNVFSKNVILLIASKKWEETGKP